MNVVSIAAAISSVALVGVGVSMALTNPNQATYEEYATEQLTTYLKDEACTQAPKVFSNFLQRQCKSLLDTGRPQIQLIISKATQRQNFILFSIYRTNLDIGPYLPAYHFETVGAFQNFYVYQAAEQE
jgi:hypothetical protein